MTCEEFEEFIETQSYQDYLVRIKLKYDCDKEYNYINELLLCNSFHEYVWDNDWYEGQQDVRIIGYIALDDIAESVFKPTGGMK